MPQKHLPFHLEECHIAGYRAMVDTRFSLGPTNLVVGINGAGKTSILKALAFLLEDVARRIGPTTLPSPKPSAFDFRGKEVSISAHLQGDGSDYSLDRVWELSDASVRAKPSFVHAAVDVGRLTRSYWQALEQEQGDLTLPLLAFYPISRAVTDIPLRVRKEEPASRREGYARAFTAERHFGSFFQWFRELEDVENETRSRGPQLNAVRRAIEAAIPDYTNLRVSRRPRLRMLIDKKDEILSIQQLSDGEQGVLTLIGDLARRAAILNPHLPDALQSPGCVLVDEIDQHLHPQWQRRVVETLRSTFPNLQFVFTSHSPIVCGSVGPDSLIVLKDGKAEPGSVYGWSMAAILKAVFDIDERPAPVHRDLVALDRAIDARDFDGARSVLNQLLSVLPPDDPEIVRANVLLPVLEQAAQGR